MAMNFNKLFLQDIIARRGSHVIDLGDGSDKSNEEPDYGSDYYNDTSSDTLEDVDGAGHSAELFDDEPTGSCQKTRLLNAILELRSAVEKQNNLQAQLNGRLTPSPASQFGASNSTDRSNRFTAQQISVKQGSTNSVMTSNASQIQSPVSMVLTPAKADASSSPGGAVKPSDDTTKKSTTKLQGDNSNQSDRIVDPSKLRATSTEVGHKKRLLSQSGLVDSTETDLASFKRCERLSKKKDKVSSSDLVRLI